MESGAVQVTVPFCVPMVLAKRLVQEKAAWIKEKQQQRNTQKEKEKGVQFPPFSQVKAEALRFTTQKVEEMNRCYGFSYAKIGVRDQKTRWGSCSKRGSLTFNYRIAFLPLHLAEYIVIHELCHLQEFHHGKAFWDLVARTVPDHRSVRRMLREYRLRTS